MDASKNTHFLNTAKFERLVKFMRENKNLRKREFRQGGLEFGWGLGREQGSLKRAGGGGDYLPGPRPRATIL